MSEKIKLIKSAKEEIFVVGAALLLGFLIMGANSLIASAQNSLGNGTDTRFNTDRELTDREIKELFKVAPDLFLYPPDKAPEGTVWGRDVDGTIVPLAPGVPFDPGKTEVLQKWPKANFPVPRITVSWYVPIFSQNDPRWKNDVMKPCSGTIGQYGCALTSDAMVFKYYGTVYQDPGMLNTCLGSCGGITSNCYLVWSVAANSCSQSKARYVGAWSFSYNKLYSMLSAGRPPIVMLKKTVSGKVNTHYVVVTSGSGTNPSNYWINDPQDGTVKRLSAYTNNGWTLSSIHEYAKR